MNSASRIPAVSAMPRHCTDPQCRKCRARAAWYRRKGWRSRKSPARRKYGRK